MVMETRHREVLVFRVFHVFFFVFYAMNIAGVLSFSKERYATSLLKRGPGDASDGCPPPKKYAPNPRKAARNEKDKIIFQNLHFWVQDVNFQR